ALIRPSSGHYRTRPSDAGARVSARARLPGMRVLAVETSTLAGGAAVLDGGLVVGEYTLDVSLTHSERLMGAIDRLLSDAGWTVRDLGGLPASGGPGAFTRLPGRR